ncbi:host attachment protein [Patescibacteria group bacterium]|nr:host attachment protein [Patescibacteria group bacterium]MBU1907450.1 host attachment protein [Patescibacteria group bacterium]
MKISEDYRDFKKPTLIVVTDHVHSKLYLARERELEQVDTITAEPERAEDKEAFHQSTSRAGGQVMMNQATGSKNIDWKEHVAHDHLFKALEENLMARLQNHEFEDLILVVEHEAKNHLTERLHHDLQERIVKTVPKNLINNPLEDLIATTCTKT